MADAFQKISQLPVLRLTVRDVAKISDELVKQMASGGDLDEEYVVSFEDDTTFTRDSSAEFLQNLDDEGERIRAITVRLTAWSQGSGGISKTVWLQLRDFGSQFHVGSNDPVWGKGAVDTIYKRFKRHRPWYAPLRNAMPAISGLVLPLAVFLIIVAVAHEDGLTAASVLVIVLSSLLLLANYWVWRLYTKHKLLPHTMIQRVERARSWQAVKVIGWIAAFVADVVTVVVVLAH